MAKDDQTNMDDSAEEMLWRQVAGQLERANRLVSARARLLEEENATFARQLRELGVEAAANSATARELPPPALEPLPGDSESRQRLSSAEADLLAELSRDEPVFCLVASTTRVDTGRWLSGSTLWLGALATELLLFAAGTRAFCERIPFSYLRRSLYNHVTGELVLAPARDLTICKAELAPSEAYQLLAQIYSDSEEDED
ncbi:MAG: hypothetical protein HN742_36945 [Lentisphaerae bacterium]|jgi:hypothetical protein|nr:hypothetical protein [Lentisphaerota bacterium]MBT4819639.1 hypothetical protein [Lentisphaerota bacterium]MBT5611898.1 hypothetical protein [Lentisphaerota bacterium]MBT7055505.1 hypothetical protein [Lentisphaerota bacterium]MBT7847515.1 hypothetical protein [Lentisphaerota bacterium]